MTRFEPGTPVRVRSDEKPSHVRTPDYVKGKMGRIEKMLGVFKNPELLAYGDPGLPEKPLYKVGFRQADLWDGYTGLADDTLYIDIYEHWLELARKEAT
jgi:nitrile hydratase subunit beta